MNILFIHGNYPGQFRSLAAELAARGARVVFLAHPDTGEGWQLPGVQVRRFEPHRAVRETNHPYLHATERAILEGQAVWRSVRQLLDEGFWPDRVLFHAGLGYGLFLRSLLPNVALVGLFEWFFRAETASCLLGEWNQDNQLALVVNNQPVLSELLDCDAAVTATDWQRQQFPPLLAQKLRVIHEGIDTNFFQPADPPLGALFLQGDQEKVQLSADDLVLTYATRGMEPLRGFPEFLRSLPALLSEFKHLQVVIAGSDRVAYSYAAPSHGGSWKQHLLAELGAFPGRERVHFTGSLVYGEYLKLLQRSDLHCYFSRPYVPSWSVLEALACGCRLVINRGGTTALAAGGAVAQLELEASDGLAPQLAPLLAQIEAEGLSRAGRTSALPPQFELSSCLLQWLALLRDLGEQHP